MTRRSPIMLASAAVFATTALLHGQETAPATDSATPATQPTASLDLSTPQKALATYFNAQLALDEKSLAAASIITDDALAPLAQATMQFNIAQCLLERTAIAQYGPKEGLKVVGRPRSAEDQIQLNLKRLRDPVVEVPDDPDITRITLKPEANPPADYKTEDVFYLHHVGDTWKLDYILTYHLSDPDHADTNKLNLVLYPHMAEAMKKIAEDVKAGKYKLPEDAAAAFSRAWDESLPENKDK